MADSKDATTARTPAAMKAARKGDPRAAYWADWKAVCWAARWACSVAALWAVKTVGRWADDWDAMSALPQAVRSDVRMDGLPADCWAVVTAAKWGSLLAQQKVVATVDSLVGQSAVCWAARLADQ